jgi:hypothetical protein
MKSFADAVIAEGPLTLVALFGYILERTSDDPRWDKLLSEAAAGIVPKALFSAEEDLDDGNVYKVKITLKGVRPAIFREVEVPNMTLGDLHEVIQTAMGWENAHPHCFTIEREEFGPILDDQSFVSWDDEETVSLGELVDSDCRRFTYEYDFGDSWVHEILVGKPRSPRPGVFYPRCIKGEFACPPEDCGGVLGYVALCEALATPKSEWTEDEKEQMEMFGRFDPNRFSIDEVNRALRADFGSQEPPPQERARRKR